MVFGKPKSLLTDNGFEHTKAIMENYLEEGIGLIKTKGKHPIANECEERVHQDKIKDNNSFKQFYEYNPKLN